MDYYQNAGFITLAILILSATLLYPFRKQNSLFYTSLWIIAILIAPCLFWSGFVTQERETQMINYMYTHQDAFDFQSETVKIQKLGISSKYSDERSSYTNYLISIYTHHNYKILENNIDYIIFEKTNESILKN